MHRRALLTAAVAAGAGCLGASTQRGDSASPTSGETAVEEPTTKEPTGSATSTPEDGITTHESLTAGGKELFGVLLEEGSVDRPSTEVPTGLWEATAVRYEGTTYTLSREPRESVAVYSTSASAVTRETVADDELVRYGDLSPDAQRVFDDAADSGSYDGPPPGVLRDAQYVERDGRYYRLRVATGDVRVWRLSVSKRSLWE
ncbi:hypothetical protein ACFO0N_05070 [Halobium salinum]|uniref:DUF7979 domain-containing protein n=1 Tax=Halobium salinum TaxID=1364940 RepID=A0ABD5PA46_9EURY|nr:hypothetical protein [Halobium salinum]